MSSRSVDSFAAALFGSACSFVAMSGPGSATSTADSMVGTSPPVARITNRVAVRMAQSWLSTYKRSVGSSGRSRSCSALISRTSTRTSPVAVLISAPAASVAAAPPANKTSNWPVSPLWRRFTVSISAVTRYDVPRRASTARPPTMVMGLPSMLSTWGITWTSVLIGAPRSSTVLPDTSSPLRWLPAVEDLAATPWILGQVQRDEQRMRQRPSAVGLWRKPTAADLGHRGYSDGGRPCRVRRRHTQQCLCPMCRHPVRHIEIGRIVRRDDHGCAVRCRRQRVGKCPPGAALGRAPLRSEGIGNGGIVEDSDARQVNRLGPPCGNQFPEQFRYNRRSAILAQTGCPERTQRHGDRTRRMLEFAGKLPNGVRFLGAHQQRAGDLQRHLASEQVGRRGVGLLPCGNRRVDQHSGPGQMQVTAQVQPTPPTSLQRVASSFDDPIGHQQSRRRAGSRSRQLPGQRLWSDRRGDLQCDGERCSAYIEHEIAIAWSGVVRRTDHGHARRRQRRQYGALSDFEVHCHTDSVRRVRCSVKTEHRTPD